MLVSSLQEVRWVEPKAIASDLNNRVFWAEARAEWPGDAATLALTFTFYRTEDRVITDADIVVNGVDWVFTTIDAEVGKGTPAKVDLETVVLHEIGHFFGLNHSEDPRAAMYAGYNKPIQRAPASDDVHGSVRFTRAAKTFQARPRAPWGPVSAQHRLRVLHLRWRFVGGAQLLLCAVQPEDGRFLPPWV